MQAIERQGAAAWALAILVHVLAWALVASAAAAETNVELKEQVRQAEIAFAKTMADRDYAAFAIFVAEDSVFFGRTEAFRGKAAVLAGWKQLYEGPQAPFSWGPETVEVLSSGELALSSGPVLDSTGKRFGTFQSIWRREKNGKWRVIFDKGADYCPPPASEKK